MTCIKSGRSQRRSSSNTRAASTVSNDRSRAADTREEYYSLFLFLYVFVFINFQFLFLRSEWFHLSRKVEEIQRQISAMSGEGMGNVRS